MSQLYSKLLATKGHGYPLYIPEPNECLPYEYRLRGISIGDVGVITSDGEFDFLFNVYLPATHPINENSVPEKFTPLTLERQDIFQQSFWHSPGTVISTGWSFGHGMKEEEGFKGIPYLSADTNAKLPVNQPSSERGDGAILVLPEGASREDLVSVDKLRDHGSQNAAAYYNFANGRRGRMAEDSSLLLVTGCDKAKSWELATYSGPSPYTLPFPMVNYSLQSECPDSMQSRFGPIPPTDTENQCIFLRGLTLSLDGHVNSIETLLATNSDQPMTDQTMEQLHVPPNQSMDHDNGDLYRKKALLIGINGNGVSKDSPALEIPHRDICALQQSIIELYGYKEEDVVLKVDYGTVEASLAPTRANILREIENLVEGAQPGDQIFFYFRHSQQVLNEHGTEEDGRDEVLMASDGEILTDDKLRQCLIDPLPADCNLVAIFDTCHSASLLDLHHHKCNNVYVHWVPKESSTRLFGQSQHLSIDSALSKERLLNIHTSTIQKPTSISGCTPPYPQVALECDGFKICGNNMAHIIALGACKDAQIAWEDSGGSLTAILIDISKKDRLKNMMLVVNYRTHAIVCRLHDIWKKWQNESNKKDNRRLTSNEERQMFRMTEGENTFKDF